MIPPLCGLLLVGGCQFSAYALPRFLEDFCNWDSEISFVRPGYFFVPGTPGEYPLLVVKLFLRGIYFSVTTIF